LEKALISGMYLARIRDISKYLVLGFLYKFAWSQTPISQGLLRRVNFIEGKSFLPKFQVVDWDYSSSFCEGKVSLF
jgi:hypothetical protein